MASTPVAETEKQHGSDSVIEAKYNHSFHLEILSHIICCDERLKSKQIQFCRPQYFVAKDK